MHVHFQAVSTGTHSSAQPTSFAHLEKRELLGRGCSCERGDRGSSAERRGFFSFTNDDCCSRNSNVSQTDHMACSYAHAHERACAAAALPGAAKQRRSVRRARRWCGRAGTVAQQQISISTIAHQCCCGNEWYTYASHLTLAAPADTWSCAPQVCGRRKRARVQRPNSFFFVAIRGGRIYSVRLGSRLQS